MRGSFFFIYNSFYFYGHAFLQVVNGEIYFFIYKYCLEQTFSFSDDHKRNITHVADTVNGTFQDGFLIQKFLSHQCIPAAHFFFPASIQKLHFLILHFKILSILRHTTASEPSVLSLPYWYRNPYCISEYTDAHPLRLNGFVP